jgi:hypothetical protein
MPIRRKLVTDAGIDPDFKRRVVDAGVQVVIAD